MKGQETEVTLPGNEEPTPVEWLCEGADPDVGINCGLCIWRIDGGEMSAEDDAAAADQIGCPCRENDGDDEP